MIEDDNHDQRPVTRKPLTAYGFLATTNIDQSL